MAEHLTVLWCSQNGAYGVMAAQHTVDVLVWVRNPLGSPKMT